MNPLPAADTLIGLISRPRCGMNTYGVLNRPTLSRSQGRIRTMCYTRKFVTFSKLAFHISWSQESFVNWSVRQLGMISSQSGRTLLYSRAEPIFWFRILINKPSHPNEAVRASRIVDQKNGCLNSEILFLWHHSASFVSRDDSQESELSSEFSKRY